jgi:hypothetical protein
MNQELPKWRNRTDLSKCPTSYGRSVLSKEPACVNNAKLAHSCPYREVKGDTDFRCTCCDECLDECQDAT